MKVKLLIMAAILAVFSVGLFGCSGEAGTNEVKQQTSEMKTDQSQAVDKTQVNNDVSDATMMGPPGGKSSQRNKGGGN